MSNIPNDPLSTDDAATGEQIALEALFECGSDHRRRLAVEHAQILLDQFSECSKEESLNLLSGYLKTLFDVVPQLTPKEVPHD